MLEDLKDLFFHPYVIALISLFIGCFVLRDVVRIIIYIFDSSRRADKHLRQRKEEKDE